MDSNQNIQPFSAKNSVNGDITQTTTATIPEKHSPKKGLLITIVCLALLFLLVIIGAFYFLTYYMNDQSKSTLENTPVSSSFEAANEETNQLDKGLDTVAIGKVAEKLKDGDKDVLIGKVAHIISGYYNKNIRQGADGIFKRQLPQALSEVDLTSLGGDSNQYVKEFLEKDLKYIIPANLYLLCAKFEQQKNDLSTAYFVQKVVTSRVDADYQCFEMTTFITGDFPETRQSVTYDDIVNFDIANVRKITKATTFSDSNIQNVTSNAVYTLNEYTTKYDLSGGRSNADINEKPGVTKETGITNFPYGFFSQEPQEWGLIASGVDLRTNKPSPVTVKIIFKQPIALSKISNLFSNCVNADCYTWTAVGITPQNSSFTVANITRTGMDAKTYSSKDISSNEQFKELHITVTRFETMYTSDIVWKKIRLEYKQ